MGHPVRSIRQKTLVVGLFLLCLKLACQPVAAQVDADLLKNAYKHGDYQVVAKLAGRLIARNPSDALAHYYLAGAYLKMKMPRQARVEYSKCLKLCPGTEMGNLSNKALTALRPYDENQPTEQEERLQREMTEERKRILARQEVELKEAQYRFDQKVSQYQKSCPTQIDLQKSTRDAYEQLRLEEESITERYLKRANALLRHSPPSGFTGAIQVGESLSAGSHVQHYQTTSAPSKAASIPGENRAEAKECKLSGQQKQKAKKGL